MLVINANNGIGYQYLSFFVLKMNILAIYNLLSTLSKM